MLENISLRVDVYSIVIDGNSDGNEHIVVDVEERIQSWSRSR